MERGQKTIVVMGATGRQGGATARRLLADGWKVRAFTRDASSAAASALARAGAELREGNMEDRPSLVKAMEGAYGVFSVQPPEWDPSDAAAKREIRLGVQVADAAKQAGVRHYVYSSVGGADRQSRFRYLAKTEIERHVREIGLQATVLRPAGFMESYAKPMFGLRQGKLTDGMRPDVPVKLIAVEDIGAFAGMAFREPQTFIGRTIELAGDAPTSTALAASLSRALRRPIRYERIPIETIRSLNGTLASIYEWLNGESYEVDFAELRRLHPGLMTFDDWLARQGTQYLKASLEASE
ncbi:NmrA/HSCARG family protein [Cohnella thailandensis]|uniref:NmrA/HSCARG family protein n=1 Tax=Cohnella thailandensis TaxID=557557 RepID=A0A841SW44_9BACL|nr:NmrA/HSCARG family protein [Cohnella thailandensis]MBB6634836.1 NmrA/HSCARG family protein [Cohnella thailandensis]MBP1975943.1 uncharacterized protein YbjT (DUF2867 family) [Cohnella thailandensis]